MCLEGRTLVDLGCGTGRDVYLLAQLVGEAGRVIGADMTDSQLAIANETLDWHTDRFGYSKSNTQFHQGYIEELSMLPVQDAEVDVIVSNCVINLSARKDLVIAEAARLLKIGGELYISMAQEQYASEVSASACC